MNLYLLLGLLISGLQCGDLLASNSNKNQSDQTLIGSYRSLEATGAQEIDITPMDIIFNTSAFQSIDSQDDRSIFERLFVGLLNNDTSNEDLIKLQRKVISFIDRHNEIGGVYLSDNTSSESFDENTNTITIPTPQIFKSGRDHRIFKKKITFKRPFNCAKPNVIVSWTGVNNNPGHNFRYEVFAKEIKPESFELVIGTWWLTRTPILRAQYIARC